MKIVSTGATLASPGFLEKKQKARRKKLKIFCGALFVLLIGAGFLLRIQSLRISTVTISGAQAIDAAKVETAVKELLLGNYLFILPRDSAFLYGNGRIKEELMKNFPRFSSVQISLSDFKELGVSVVEREPFALYCGEGTGGCYFLDKTGFIFDNSPAFSDGVYIVYTLTPQFSEPLGTAYLPVDEFTPIAEFLSKLPSIGALPLSLILKENEFTLIIKGGAKILWPRGSDMNRIYANLEAFLMSPTISADKEFLLKVRELDLRTEDKVFYRFNE